MQDLPSFALFILCVISFALGLLFFAYVCLSIDHISAVLSIRVLFVVDMLVHVVIVSAWAGALHLMWHVL